MGCYINPENETKEEWLIREARMISEVECRNWHDFSGAELPVILVDNGLFTAAGIAFCSNERDAFMTDDDPRPKLYFAASKEKLLSVCCNLKLALDRT